ncbi:hypothetical protein KP509_20G026000 [Ceratopteris richardii]|uniref:Protein kinase domain-containing protein n=1 Tax=Ceratopteris richardii TaxID=49495 RepID=A0A8T2SH83_CERRI|nr:hypothetical protein KP509_20G026000 [Ceratopteris richardii]KAH7331314.1 hypothetical protein KP509_20G026000 [Ceratopteris richardii]
MEWSESFHALFFFAICIQLSMVPSAAIQLNDDVLGLIVFKSDLVDPTKSLRSWTQDDNSPCNWAGVMCDPRNGRVISLNLSGLALSGRIGWGIGKVSYLQTLSLAHNNLSGTISVNVAQLTLLQEVDLSHNILSGPLDSTLGALPFLRSLDLSFNMISGTIPAELFNKCNKMRFLSVRNNLLEGSMPITIGSCTSLRTLDVSNNRLNNTLPTSMAAFTVLRYLDVSHNSFSGPLPTQFPPNLQELRLQENRFSGVISSGIGQCSLLQYIDLSNNFLSSEVPSSMRSLTSLSVLNMFNNNIFGNVPSWIGGFASLKILNLSHNAFYGSIPFSIASLISLEVIDFSRNKFSGSIPFSFSGFTSMKHVDLNSNQLNGSIPPIVIAPGLVSLNLARNLLMGDLSTASFSQCYSLEILDLAQNQLSGVLPNLSGCTNMVHLNISNNHFVGDITNLTQGNRLTTLDLSHNQLYGSVPARFGNDSQLSKLFLEKNNLNGSIPADLGRLSTLTEINLASNDLSGSIPPQLGGLSHLEALDLSYNKLTGRLPSELEHAEKLARFNVSYNQLQGPIPENGVYSRFNASAYVGNGGLCGASLNTSCPNVMPKPIVLNPNSSNSGQMGGENPWKTLEHTHILSASAILAIAAAAAISVGVVIVSILNGYARAGIPRAYSDILRSSFSSTPSPELLGGKLVMFTKDAYPRAEEWIMTAHQALLNKESELGRGGFGTVYKAVLGDGRMVAIKKLMASTMVKSEEEFEKEMQILGNIKHRNLLELQGYYWTPELQLLLHEFIPNGNLYSRLHERSPSDSTLSWTRRFNITLGVARGLAHLHHACNPQVIHYNVKSSNILLDDDFNPQIADYGLAKLLPMLDKYLMSSRYQSALGYMAPELACQSSRINEKCDVYGYGIMVLELVTGRRPIEYREDDVIILCDYVRALLEEGKAMRCVDRSLHDYVEEELLPVIKLGLICTSQVPSNRPSMAEVVHILELIRTTGNSQDLL